MIRLPQKQLADVLQNYNQDGQTAKTCGQAPAKPKTSKQNKPPRKAQAENLTPVSIALRREKPENSTMKNGPRRRTESSRPQKRQRWLDTRDGTQQQRESNHQTGSLKQPDDKPTIREEVADMESQKLDNHTAIGPPCTNRLKKSNTSLKPRANPLPMRDAKQGKGRKPGLLSTTKTTSQKALTELEERDADEPTCQQHGKLRKDRERENLDPPKRSP
ncbi:hypothetical protein Bca4012_088184 [Brassica carinata]